MTRKMKPSRGGTPSLFPSRRTGSDHKGSKVLSWTLWIGGAVIIVGGLGFGIWFLSSLYGMATSR